MSRTFPTRLKLENLNEETRRYYESLSPEEKRRWEIFYNLAAVESEMLRIRQSRQRRRQLRAASKPVILPANISNSTD
jgi:hypothetical protein